MTLAMSPELNLTSSNQNLSEPAVAPERVKKRLDREQVDKAGLMVDRILQAVECQIEIRARGRRPCRAWAGASRPMSNGTSEEERHRTTPVNFAAGSA
jgi:hypothetical protein